MQHLDDAASQRQTGFLDMPKISGEVTGQCIDQVGSPPTSVEVDSYEAPHGRQIKFCVAGARVVVLGT